jgi:HEAT repeat protein
VLLRRENPGPTPPAPELEGATVATLAGLLADGRPGVRADAACSLGDRLRSRELDGLDTAVHEQLAALLDDPEVMVRFEAAVALAELHDHRATALLLGAMRSRSVRLDAIRALGTLGDPRAVPELSRFMAKWMLPWADRLQAAAALCALGDAAGAAHLVGRLASRRPAERAAAIHFLGESRHPRARALLEPILAAPRDPHRDVAARALGLCADPGARAALEAARSTADAELREDIDQALARL